jgi:hypothetical protein
MPYQANLSTVTGQLFDEKSSNRVLTQSDLKAGIKNPGLAGVQCDQKWFQFLEPT